MKNLLYIILLTGIISCGNRRPYIKEITIVDDTDYTTVVYGSNDTLYKFIPGVDSFRIVMDFNKVSNGYPLPDMITEIDNALDEYLTIKYNPQNFAGDNILNPLGWNFSKNQLFNLPHHKNTLAFIQVDGWLDFEFNGHRIDYYAEVFESYGIAGVSVDNAPETMVDLYSPTEINNSTLVFTADSLDDKVSHTIRIRYTRQRNPNSNNANARITFDKLVTYARQGNYYAPPASSATQQYDPE